MAITKGTYNARACGECVLGESANKRTPFLEYYYKINDGENKGGLVRWTGYFPSGNQDVCKRTIQSLQISGWEGDDISEFADGHLHGLDRNDVSIVVDVEEYENDRGERRHSPRVQWVNRAGGFLNKEAAMNKTAAATFGERMRNLVSKRREEAPAPKPSAAQSPPPPQALPAPATDSGTDDEIPF